MSTTRRTLLALAAALTAPALVVAQQPVPAPAVGGAASRPMRARGERHPEIRRALRALENARVALQNGAQDFGGHREAALDATNNAIKQLQLALQSDRR
jgi:hypothetical protein